MLDLKFIRDHSGLVKDAIRVKHINLDLDELLKIDRELLDVRQRVETLQAERNACRANRCDRAIPCTPSSRDRCGSTTSEP